jgi:hypothetical protein
VPCSESQQKWLVGLRRCELAKRQRRPETGYLPTLRLLEPTTTHAHSHRTRGSPCGARTSQWSRRRDLNPRPTHYECVALPLSYPGKRRNHTSVRQQASSVEALHSQLVGSILNRVFEVHVDRVRGPNCTYVSHRSKRRCDPLVLHAAKRSAIR